MDLDFNELINNYLFQEKRAKTIGRYYPSEIGGCLRKTWFSYKMPKETDKDLLRIFEAGNNLHELVSKIFESEKNPHIELIETELPFKQDEGDFTISGRIDNLILVKIENKEVLIEVKSCKYLPNEFRKEHESQLQFYMHSLGVHQGILLYIKKDDLETKEFEISYDKEKAETLLKRFEALNKALKENKIPEAEARHDEDKIWLCERCPWKEECWQRED